MSSMMKVSAKRVIAVLLSVLTVFSLMPITTLTAFAETTGMTVYVIDYDGNPIEGAAVNISNVAGIGESGKTGADGKVTFSTEGIEDGVTVSLIVTCNGYEQAIQKGIAFADGTHEVRLRRAGHRIVTVSTEGSATVKLNGEERTTIEAEPNTEVKVEITPAENHHISRVLMGEAEQDLPEKGESFTSTVVVTDDITFTVATTEQVKITVSKNNQAGGEVRLNNEEVNALTIDKGGKVSLIIKPAEGYWIESVMIGNEAQMIENNLDFSIEELVVSENIDIVATFVEVYTVEAVFNSENGEVYINESETNGGTVEVKSGTEIFLKAEPKENYRVSKVLINDEEDTTLVVQNDGKYEKTLSADKDYIIVVTFTLNRFLVNVCESENGTIETDLTDGAVEYGGSCNVIITPSEGYAISSITVNETEVSGNTEEVAELTTDYITNYNEENEVVSFTIQGITTETTVNVTFEKKLVVTVNVEGNATIELNGEKLSSIAVKHGTDVEIKITPGEGCYIKSVSMGDLPKKGEAFTATVNVTEDITLEAATDTLFTVKARKTEGNGTVVLKTATLTTTLDAAASPETHISLPVGNEEQIEVMVTPAANYWIDAITINGVPQEITDENKIKFSQDITITADAEIIVSFVKYYTVEIEISGDANGTVSITTPTTEGGKVSTVKNGEEVTVEANANDGYHVGSVKVNNHEVYKASDGENTKKFTRTFKVDEGITIGDETVVSDTCTYNFVVTFAKNQYRVYSETTSGGNVSFPNDSWPYIPYETRTVSHGNSCKVLIRHDDNYNVEEISVNGFVIKGDTSDVTASSTDYIDNYKYTEDEISFTIYRITGETVVKVKFKPKNVKSIEPTALFNADEALWNDGRTYVFNEKGATFSVVDDSDTILLCEYNHETKKMVTIGGGENHKTVTIDNGETRIDKVELGYRFLWNIEWFIVDSISEDNPINIVVDNTAPSIELESDEAHNGEFYNESFNATVTIKDEGYYSGIKEIEYFITEASIDDTIGYDKVGDELKTQGDVLYSHTDEAGIKNEEEKTIKVEVEERKNNTPYVKLWIKATDRADNVAYMTKSFKINCTKPVLESITIADDGASTTGTKTGNYDVTRTACIVITDRWDSFDLENAKRSIEITATDAAGNTVTIPENAIGLASSDDPQSNTHMINISFNVNANYEWSIDTDSYSNKAGLTMEKAATFAEIGDHIYNFAVDTLGPTGTIEFNSTDRWNTLLNIITFGIWSNENITATATAYDEICGDEVEISYYKDSGDEPIEETTLDSYVFQDNPYTVDTEEKFVIYARLIDKAGNRTYICTDGAIVDKKPSTIEIMHSETADGGSTQEVYNDDVKVSITVSDMFEGINNYSGIKEIIYEVKNDGEVTQRGTLFSFDYDPKTETVTVIDWDSDSQEPTQPIISRGDVPKIHDLVNEWSGYVIVDKELNNSSNVTVEVKTVDNAGNPSENAIYLKINIDPITATIDVDGERLEGADDGFFSVEKRTATITITDREDSFDAEAATRGIDIITDSQEETPYTISNWISNGGIHTAFIEFTGDAEYSWSFKYTNKARNTLETENITVTGDAPFMFCIDDTEPEISVDYGPETVHNGEYFNTDRTATVTVTERNFNPARIAVSVIAEENETDIIDYAAYLKDEANWTQGENDTYVAVISYTVEANYRFGIELTDKANNKNIDVDYGASAAPTQFTIDKTKPADLTIKINGDSMLARENEEIAFNTFYGETIAVELSADGNISGINLLAYQKVASADEYDEQGTWTEYNTATGIVVSPNEKCIIYFKAEDKASNISYANSVGIIVDNKAPEALISPAATNATGIYNGNVMVDISVIDPGYVGESIDENGYYAGLENICYKIRTTDTDAVAEGVLLDETSGIKAGAIIDDDNLICGWNGSIEISADKFNSNNVIVEITAVDNAGNKYTVATEEGDIKIDITPPTIDVSYTNNAADSGMYFNADRIAKVVVTERNLNFEDVEFTVTKDGLPYPVNCSWTKNEGTGNLDDTTWTANVVFDTDGDYQFSVRCKDAAGWKCEAEDVNYGESTAPTIFTIDKTTPTVAVIYNNNSAANGNYYDAERIATVTITEHNFDLSRVVVSLRATDDGNSVNAPKVSSWSTYGDRHIATISYSDDAHYYFDIAIKDKAGNNSADFAEHNFYVDTTDPALSITGVENRSANNGDVIPIVTYSDTNFDADEVIITLTGANRKGVEINGSYENVHNGQIFTFNNFDRQQEIDDIYTLTATLTDKAGNTSTETIVFSVNRFGSTYILSEETEKLNGTYTDMPIDLVITEVNADELSNIVVTLFKNNEPIVLAEGSDYTIDVDGGDDEWYLYTYTIFAKNFVDDAVYSITIESDDAAGNNAKSDTDVKNTPIIFGIDDTLPIINVENLKSNETYALDNMTVHMSVKDNLRLEKVIVELDGKEIKTWYADELDDIVKNGGNFAFYISGESASAHNLIVYAVDAAGNGEKVSNTVLPGNAEKITNFYVTTNLWVRYYTNKPLFFGSVGSVMLAGSLVVFLIAYKRKKKDD